MSGMQIKRDQPINKRKQFFSNEEMNPSGGFTSESETSSWRKQKPKQRALEDVPNQRRDYASDYFYNNVLMPERKQAFAANPVTPFNADEIAGLKESMPLGEAPTYLGLSNAMTPLQQRTAIAAGALNSNDPRYKDPDALQYYMSQAFNNITDTSNIAPVEQQFISSLGGSAPADDSVGGFLSALYDTIQQHIAGQGTPYTPVVPRQMELPDYTNQALAGKYAQTSSNDGGGE